VPGDAKRGFATPCEGDCGRQGRGNAVSGTNRGDVWAPTRPIATPRLRGPGCVGVARRIAPRRGMGRVGRVVGQRTVHSAYLPPVELPYPPRAANHAGRPRRRRGQTGSAYHRPARSRRPAAPSAHSVPLSTNHARSAGESQTPICAGGRTPSPGPPVRLRSATVPPILPAGDSSAGAKTGLGPQVVGLVRLSSTRAHRPNPRRRRIGGRAVQPPPASRPGSCANPRSASQPGPHDRRIPVRSRGRNAIGAIESKFATSSWGTFPTCRPANGTLRAQNGAQNGTGPIK